MLLAIVFPGVSLMLHRNFAAGLFFLLLQPTVVGWVIGAVVATRSLKRERRRQRRGRVGRRGISIITPAQWAGAIY